MKSKAQICQIVKEIYSITGVPVFVFEEGQTPYALPVLPMDHFLENHLAALHDIIEENSVRIGVPHVAHLYFSVLYSIIRLDEKTILQIGPIASHDFNFSQYIQSMLAVYPELVVKEHIKLLQGAPKVDINYFLNLVVHYANTILGTGIVRTDIVLPQAMQDAFFSVSPHDFNPSAISVDNLSMNDEIFHVIRSGDIAKLSELQKKRQSSSTYYFQENDVHFLRISLIFYGAIACHYAFLGGIPEKNVKDLFRLFLNELGSLTKPSDFWVLLSDFSKTLCHRVHDIHNPAYESEILFHCIRYIDGNLHSRITMEDLEEAAHASRKTIFRHFVDYLGTTPSAYIADRKVTEAAYLLEKQGFSIIEIANLLGYSSQSHLNRCFKEKYGCTPAEYRKAKPV